MMILLLSLWRQEQRARFKGYLSILHLLLSVSGVLLGYWLTSRSIGEGLKENPLWLGKNFFEFVVIGEMCLALPLSAMDSVYRFVLQADSVGILDEIFLHGKKIMRTLIIGGVALMAYDFMTFGLYAVLLLGMGVLGFSQLLQYMILILLSLPLFALLGLFAALVFLAYRRGSGMVAQLQFLLQIFSGVFFPLAVLPDVLQGLVQALVPTAFFLEKIRHLQMGLWDILYFPVMTGFMYLILKQIFPWAIKKYLKRPSVEIRF